MPINNAASNSVPGPLTVMPGMTHAASASPTAVTSILTIKPCIFLPEADVGELSDDLYAVNASHQRHAARKLGDTPGFYRRP